MAQGYDKSLGMIAKILRAQSEEVALEPLPDLIHHLHQQEQARSAQAQVKAEPREQPQKVS